MKLLKDTTRLGGVLFLLLSGWMIVTALQFKYTGADPMGPGKYPIALAAATFVLSFLLVCLGDKKRQENKEDSEQERESAAFQPLLVTVVAMLVYLCVFEIIGFILSSVLFLFGLSMYYDRTQWKIAILYSVGFTAILYLLFRVMLGILLPTIWL